MKQHLIDYTLYLADNALILGHRNSEWCGHGPILEQDIAITNISLDLIGQARNFYQYAAQLINESTDKPVDIATEDTLAYLREKKDFKNCLLVEQSNGDWAKTILRQFLFSAYQYYLFRELQNSRDGQLAAIAEKSLKEVIYHLRWSSEWVIRLGDGTQESNERILKAAEELWRYTGELFERAGYEFQAASEGIGIDIALLEPKWKEKVTEIFNQANLPFPDKIFQQFGGKQGDHTEQLDDILKDLQVMQRTYPGCEW